jgi:chaperonin GroES
MALIPLYNKAIVEIIEEEEGTTTASGLYVPGKRNIYYKGVVTGVGKGHFQNAQRIPMDVKVGDKVLFLKNTGLAVELNDIGETTKVLLGDTDIFAVETED